MPRGIGGCRDSRVRHRRVHRCRHLSHLSFFPRVHRSPDQRQQAIGSRDHQPDERGSHCQRSHRHRAEHHLHCRYPRQDDLEGTNVTCVSSPTPDQRPGRRTNNNRWHVTFRGPTSSHRWRQEARRDQVGLALSDRCRGRGVRACRTGGRTDLGPAGCRPVYTMTPERIAASTAALVGLIGAVIGGLALARSRHAG
jgi:hypothetical protein